MTNEHQQSGFRNGDGGGVRLVTKLKKNAVDLLDTIFEWQGLALYCNKTEQLFEVR